MSLPLHAAIRYVVPLREGGSLPAIVETQTAGLWVAKFVGAGQGARALIAEILVGELGRELGLPVPDLALIDVAPSFARSEPDPEIQDLLRASHGINVGIRYLDGAFNFDQHAASDVVTPELAAEIVWFDALVTNIDRTARNPNMMVHGDALWLIDHGATIYFHHAWDNVSEASMQRPFPAIANHVLLPAAGSIDAADARLASRVDRELLAEIAGRIPDELLMHAPQGAAPAFPTAQAHRDAYVRALVARMSAPRSFAAAAEEARAAARGAS